jgi:uncharacterized protein (DUF488 family)
MNAIGHPILTVGHSTLSMEEFLEVLSRNGINVVADVRSAPFSRFNPQFNRESLARGLQGHGIKYVFLGRELGARSEDPSCYKDGRVVFDRLSRTDLFQSGIDRILHGAMEHRIVLMCAEKEPLDCHRTLMVARVLAERGIVVEHILADGLRESHEATMERLLDIVGLPHSDLFRSKGELLAEALERQEKRVAYFDAKLAADARGDS